MLCLEKISAKGRADVVSETVGVGMDRGALPEKSFLEAYIGASVLPPDGVISGNDHRKEMSLDPIRVIDTTGVASSAVIHREASNKLSNESKRHSVEDSDNW